MSTTHHPANNSIDRLENGNIQFKLTIPWTKISHAYENRVIEEISNSEIPGFRKGKAPRNLVEPKLNRSDLISKALSDLLPDTYSTFVKANNLKPILYPHIQVDKGKEGEDWEFTVTTCEAPIVILPDYKKGLSSITIKPEQSKISSCIDYLKAKSKVTIPEMLVEEEANHRLSSLVENITHIGLSLEKYLQTKKISTEELKNQTTQAARQDLETEFILAQIQTQEKLTDRDKAIEFIQSLVPTEK